MYYLYVRLYDIDGNLLAEDKSTDLMTMDSDLLTEGLAAYDDWDGDEYLYLQNNAEKELKLVAVYPDSIITANFSGTFDATKVQITNIEPGDGWGNLNQINLIFQSDYDNTAGTYEVSGSILGNGTGLANSADFVLAVISLTTASDAVTPTSRYFSGDFTVAAGEWTDYNGNLLTSPLLGNATLKIGYLGDIADDSNTYGTVPNMIPKPDGVFGINDITAFAMGWNGISGGIQDELVDLAPYQGTIPDVWSTPDDVIDYLDLNIFQAMFDWYNAQTFSASLPENSNEGSGNGNIASAEVGQDVVMVNVREEGVKTIVEVLVNDIENLMSGELTLLFNDELTSLSDYRNGEFISADNNLLFKGYNRENGFQVFFSSMNPSQPSFSGTGELAVFEFMNLGSTKSDISVGYKLLNTTGAVISSGSNVIEMDILPSEFSLEAAYPNPFNSMTRLAYGLPEASSVQVNVFDISGRLVANLVNGEMQAGYHTAVWNAENVSTGLYLVRMETSGFVGIRKVMLVK